MFVYVLNSHGKPLMPCSPAKARHLLKAGKAKVVRRTPFTIKLLFGSSGYTQPVTAGMDSGSKTIGVAAVANNQVVYQAEVTLRSDVSAKMQQRSAFRRARRARKTRYRPARWANRASMRTKGRLTPSIRSKVDSHLREKAFVEKILPVSRWKVELAAFDIHKIVNPTVSGVGYQAGPQKGFYNIKAYILHRDGYRCQSGRTGVKHSAKLHIHHKIFRSQGGTDDPSNLTALCETCHDDLHAGLFVLKTSTSESKSTRKSATKHPTEIGIVKAALVQSGWAFETIYGYETKFRREQLLGLPKSRANDAIAIACDDHSLVGPSHAAPLLLKTHVAKGDYQQTKGPHGNLRIPTGKLFGLRKFDRVTVLTSHGRITGFVKGKRSSGYFAIGDIAGTPLHNSVKARDCRRLAARSTTLAQYAGPTSPVV